MQNIVKDKANEVWFPCNDTTYRLLHEMEEEGLVTSYWYNNDIQDTHTKYKRFYSVTDKGLEELVALKAEHLNTLPNMISILEHFERFVFKDKPEQAEKK